MPDIDIDFADRSKALALFNHHRASRIEEGKLVPHNTGVYLHPVPIDARTNLCAVTYDKAEEEKYFKIDFLNVGIYKNIKNEAHILELMAVEPLWDLLEDASFTDLLFHVNGHSGILKEMKPRSVEQLAMVLAIIRPAKRHLIGKSWGEIERDVWTKPTNDDYYFKKSHAIAYALTITVQMNQICESINQG